MTAPAAPVIRVRTTGEAVYVWWRPVESATDYNLYVGDQASPAGIEAQFDDTDLNSDGWFKYVFREAGDVYVNLTALNSGAEESNPSNEVHLHLTGPGVSFGFPSDGSIHIR